MYDVDFVFFFSSRRRHTRCSRDWSSDVCSSDLPQIHMKVIVTDNPPTGMGEVGIPCVAPAIGNAVAQLTGRRLRHLPMSPERVRSEERRVGKECRSRWSPYH